MECIKMTNAAQFLSEVEPLLLKKEACNNLPLGLINRFVNESQEVCRTDKMPYFGVVKEGDQVLYTFMQTPPHNLILSHIDDISPTVIHFIAKHLYNQSVSFPGVIGPSKLVKPFVERWNALHSSDAAIDMRQFVYRLDTVNSSLPKQTGQLMKAKKEHKDLIVKWLVAFGDEAHVPTRFEEAETMASRIIQMQSVYLWEVDGYVVSMVNQSRKSKNGATINAVYTPDEYKGNGFATASVAAISQQLLEEGNQFCSLFADADNPVSNHIYQKIGYRIIGDSIVYALR